MTYDLVRFPSMNLQWEREIPEPSRTGTSRNREREWSLEGQESDTNNSPIVSDIKLKWKIDKSLSTQKKSLKRKGYFSPKLLWTKTDIYNLFSMEMVRNFMNLSISCGWKVALYIIITDRVTNIICRTFLLLAVLSLDI